MTWIALAVLLICAGLLWWRRREAGPSSGGGAKADHCQTDSCGVTCFCDDESLKRRMSEEIVYFEDEELDAFRGRAAEDYSEEEIEQFSDVLTTLRPDEVGDWLHSLERRGVALPTVLKDEAILLMTAR